MTADEQKLIIKAPALLSALAASSHHKINDTQKTHVIKLAHLHSFTSDPDLRSYYEKVDKHFIENFEEVVQQYSPFDDAKRDELKKEIEKVNEIISTLDD